MDSNAVDGGHLKAFIERIEKLEEEKRALADDVKDVYGEAKSMGFDPKIMRKIISLRRQDKGKREEEEEILSVEEEPAEETVGEPAAKPYVRSNSIEGARPGERGVSSEFLSLHLAACFGLRWWKSWRITEHPNSIECWLPILSS
jgi:uncharacterized protein (UPF0335 family)